MEASNLNSILYSIIIPHYNIPDLLSRCLRSIPERDDIQVIVVDDNSPGNENYRNQIKELSRKNVEFVVTKDGLGAGHARNVGLQYAKGTWIVFCDSDDFFDIDFPILLDEFSCDNHDVVYFNIKCCDCYNTAHVYNNVNRLKKYYETGNELYIRICYTEPWGKFIKRSLIIDNGIDFQETKAHNDLLFSVKVGLLAKSIKVIDKILYWYVIREGSIGNQSGNESFVKLCDRALAWYETQRFLNEKGIRTSFYLPVRPCVTALKQNFITYLRMLIYAHKNGMKTYRIIIDTIRIAYYHTLSNFEAITFESMISKESLYVN